MTSRFVVGDRVRVDVPDSSVHGQAGVVVEVKGPWTCIVDIDGDRYWCGKGELVATDGRLRCDAS